jgi:hypothetical protein
MDKELVLVLNHRITSALTIAASYGQIDGEHHKEWAIDQMVRALLPNNYEDFVAKAKNGEDGPNTYEWKVGIAPP